MSTKKLSYTFHTTIFRKLFHKVRWDGIRWWFLYLEHMPHDELNVLKKTNVLQTNTITYRYVNQKAKLHFLYHNIQIFFHKVRGDRISWWLLYLKHVSHDELNAWKRQKSFKIHNYMRLCQPKSLASLSIPQYSESSPTKSGETVLGGDFST